MKVAYEMDLPMDLAIVHTMFLVSMLRRFIDNENTIVPLEDVSIIGVIDL